MVALRLVRPPVLRVLRAPRRCQRCCDCQLCPGAFGRTHLQPPADGFHPLRHTAQAGGVLSLRVGPATPVIGDDGAQSALVQRSATVACEARACLEAFVSASATAK